MDPHSYLCEAEGNGGLVLLYRIHAYGQISKAHSFVRFGRECLISIKFHSTMLALLKPLNM